VSERPPAEYLGRALAAARAERGLKRMQLKDASGLSYPYIAELENGGKFPSQKALQALADALGMLPSDLLARAEAIESATPLAQSAATSGPGPGDVAPGTAAPSAEPDVVSALVDRVMTAVEPRLREWLRMEVTLAVQEELRHRGEQP